MSIYLKLLYKDSKSEKERKSCEDQYSPSLSDPRLVISRDWHGSVTQTKEIIKDILIKMNERY